MRSRFAVAAVCLLVFSVSLLLAGCVSTQNANPQDAAQQPSADAPESQGEDASIMKLQSPAFAGNSDIPEKFTCKGEGTAPALSWSNIPQGAKSLALTLRDPDAPASTFTHWIVYNIPLSVSGIAEGGALPAGAVEMQNDFGSAGYGAPCPPSGTHHYIFTLYALDTPRIEGATSSNIFALLSGHATQTATLTGLCC